MWGPDSGPFELLGTTSFYYTHEQPCGVESCWSWAAFGPYSSGPTCLVAGTFAQNLLCLHTKAPEFSVLSKIVLVVFQIIKAVPDFVF